MSRPTVPPRHAAADPGRSSLETKQESGKGRPARRVMAVLLLFIALSVVLVLLFFGLKDPDKGPGNVPANGDAVPLRDNGSPPTSK